MKNLAKIFSIVLCIAMLFALCACGGSNGESSQMQGAFVGFDSETDSDVGGSTSGNGAGTASVGNISGTTVESKVTLTGSDPFANVPKRLKGTTVTFAHFGDEGATEYQKVGKAFEKKTGIKIVWKSYNQSEYVAQVAKAITGGAPPDIIVNKSFFPFFLEIAQPLNNIIDLSDTFWDEEITKNATVNGKTYFVNSLEGPWVNASMVFYNKNLFSSSGITTPTDYYKQGKWTYENFKKCLEDVTKAGSIGGFIDPLALNTARGYTMFAYDPNTATFKSNLENSVSGYTLTTTCFKEGLWSSSAWSGTFASGTIGSFLSSTYGLKYNGYFKDMDDNMLVAVPLPSSYQGKATKQVGSIVGYGIAKGAKNPEGAAYFLRYYLDYEYYAGAGAKVFKNKNLEKTYFDELIPLIKKEGRYFESNKLSYYSSVGQDIDNILMPNGDINEVDPAQIPAILSSKKNVFDTIVKGANDKLAQYK